MFIVEILDRNTLRTLETFFLVSTHYPVLYMLPDQLENKYLQQWRDIYESEGYETMININTF